MSTRFALPFALLLSVSALAQSQEKPALPNLKPYTEGGPFVLNVLDTTPNAKAWANVILHPRNFLNCSGSEIALCYYSGPAGPAPCRLRPDGTEADCTCYVIPAGASSTPNLWKVDIHAILNLDVYRDTVKRCGQQGGACSKTNSAPACASITQNTFYPSATLVSTFSTYMAQNNGLSIKQISCPSGKYVGCMTAPCKKLNKTDAKTGLELAECVCPAWTGPFQIAQGDGTAQCTLDDGYVWSAATHAGKPVSGQSGK
ncbi:hypothetical protein V8J88_20980 [Massilia sp. W12]|uniref:hypothetical protein n=1 Tax=Massilia sp. W12 TaxID=3126507 RepID=UPI0030D3DB20